MSGQEPLVSVLMPAYNHGLYIESALESVRALSHGRLELLVLDDASADDTADKAEAWVARNKARFERAEVHRNPANIGITRGLNRLVAMAAGDFIAPLASDDELLPDGVSLRIKALDANPDCLAAIGDAITMDEHGAETERSTFAGTFGSSKAALVRPDLILEELVVRWSVPGPVLLLRRDAYDPAKGVGSYDESLYFEDRDFYLRLLRRRALLFVDQPVARYRKLAQSACRAPEATARMARHMIRAQRQNLAGLPGFCKAFLRADNARLWFTALEAEGVRWIRFWPCRRIRRHVEKACQWFRRAHDRRVAEALRL